tara:strand:+ start:1019 stop:1501 length:483 start_codon:yes stop_codon:yes gene_type:complete
MNIFYLHRDPKKAARYQYNKHVVKMILESAQMLCTAHHHYDENTDVPYKKAHYNHPSTKWVRQSDEHYDWLYNHMLELGNEYTKRYGREHLSITKCKWILWERPYGIPSNGFMQPPQAMPDEYKDPCSVQAYWNYYIGDKFNIAHKYETIYKTRPLCAAS